MDDLKYLKAALRKRMLSSERLSKTIVDSVERERLGFFISQQAFNVHVFWVRYGARC